MEPHLTGFAIGLLLGAAKVGVLGTLGFGIAWWRARSRLRYYEQALPDPARLEERLAGLEQAAEITTATLSELLEGQSAVLRRLDVPPGAELRVLPDRSRIEP